MAKVLNRRRDRIPRGAVYVGRPTFWGNPARVGVDGTRDECLDQFRKIVASNRGFREAVKRELRGKDLVCWCAPLPCHADVLLEVANE